MMQEEKLLRSWLLLSKIQKHIGYFLMAYVLFSSSVSVSQIANYVNNGSFEDRYSCNPWDNTILNAKYWRSIDSLSSGGVYCSLCSGLQNVPYNNFGFQWPHSGNSYILSTFLCPPPTCSNINNRWYLRNRIKANLEIGKTYCVKFYVNISNNSTHGIDGFGAYFGDNSLDTITKCTTPITYLLPQIQNTNNNIITDTLGWTLITGTFVATGNEKHLVIGNFKSNATTNKTLINSANPGVGVDICIDDVSCIDLDLPAYAGPDLYCIPGNSVYIGRPQDVGIDEACMWYKLPNMSTAIDTAAGLSVVPAGTSTYVVRQEICGNVKWDTVVVFMSAVGMKDLGLMTKDLRLYPVPAQEELTVQFSMDVLEKEFTKGEVLNNLGQVVKELDLNYSDKRAVINIKELPNGVYVLNLRSGNFGNISKRFVIAR